VRGIAEGMMKSNDVTGIADVFGEGILGLYDL